MVPLFVVILHCSHDDCVRLCAGACAHLFFHLLWCFNIILKEKENLTIQRCFYRILKFSYLKISCNCNRTQMRIIGIAHFDFSFLTLFLSLYMVTKCLIKLNMKKKGQTLTNEWNATYIEDKKDLSMALIISYHWCMWLWWRTLPEHDWKWY